MKTTRFRTRAAVAASSILLTGALVDACRSDPVTVPTTGPKATVGTTSPTTSSTTKPTTEVTSTTTAVDWTFTSVPNAPSSVAAWLIGGNAAGAGDNLTSRPKLSVNNGPYVLVIDAMPGSYSVSVNQQGSITIQTKNGDKYKLEIKANGKALKAVTGADGAAKIALYFSDTTVSANLTGTLSAT